MNHFPSLPLIVFQYFKIRQELPLSLPFEIIHSISSEINRQFLPRNSNKLRVATAKRFTPHPKHDVYISAQIAI
jgi:hypothetical protein